jgi:2,5-dihydroxypyridine 5,6-dioxygenase
MKRRDFFKTSAVPAAATAAGFSLFEAAAEPATRANPDQTMIDHCRRILDQNLLKAGQRLLVATSDKYDADFTRGILLAGAEIGAVGGHLAILPKLGEQVWFSKDAGATRGLTPWHWDLYASADLLIVAGPEAGARTPVPREYASGLPVMTSYESKQGDHPYRTDFERICREGSRTRWLKLNGTFDTQVKYFPTVERKERTLRAVRAVHKGREIRITGAAGTDFRVRKEGRPGHAQYGIADVPGRWDNFGYGCVVVGPEEYTAEGVVVLDPGDMVQSYPRTLPAKDMAVREPVRITFESGYVTKVEGGADATRFREILASFNNKESFGISHVGFGCHERTDPADPGFAHHNKMGSILFSLGANQGHGLGGEALNYSGMGLTTRKAPSHSHFAVYGQDFYCDGVKLVERGRLLLS